LLLLLLLLLLLHLRGFPFCYRITYLPACLPACLTSPPSTVGQSTNYYLLSQDSEFAKHSMISPRFQRPFFHLSPFACLIPVPQYYAWHCCLLHCCRVDCEFKSIPSFLNKIQAGRSLCTILYVRGCIPSREAARLSNLDTWGKCGEERQVPGDLGRAKPKIPRARHVGIGISYIGYILKLDSRLLCGAGES